MLIAVVEKLTEKIEGRTWFTKFFKVMSHCPAACASGLRQLGFNNRFSPTFFLLTTE
jgi:hypothetical protein